MTVLVNPAAGRESIEERCARVSKAFANAGVAVEVTALPNGGRTADAARAAVAAGANVVVAGGGDGTVSGVASALAGTSTALGVLPLGTLNHFAKDLGIPLTLEAAVATIAAGRIRTVDAGEVNGQTFVNNASIGIYPDIVAERERLRQLGHYKWIAFAIASARILRRYRRLLVRLAAADAIERARTAFLMVGNNEYQVEGLALGARARLDAGVLSAYFAPRVHTHELPKLVAVALAGRARQQQALETLSAPELHVETPGLHRLRVAIDGEVVLMRAPLAFRIRPAALKVIAPAPDARSGQAG